MATAPEADGSHRAPKRYMRLCSPAPRWDGLEPGWNKLMPIPGDPGKAPLPAEDATLELVAETLEGLESPARAQFLQRFFKTITHLELTEPASLEYWEKILTRWRQLNENTRQDASPSSWRLLTSS